jgi:tRNA-Thr(GGU) m(6)t(6)A37 methyltransferase TsaA
MDEIPGILVKPIGHVKNDFNSSVPDGYEDKVSEIILMPEFSEALDGIDKNSHIMVLFWLNEVDDDGRSIRKLHPKGRDDLPLVGVLATRSPRRPNPIGLRAVKLEKREGNVLTVKGLDAFNGSPVLDIKPYSLKHDFVEDATGPPWVRHMHSKNRK